MGRPDDTATLDERSSAAAEADRDAASSTAPTPSPAAGRTGSLEIGARLGRHPIRARVGRGGMGEVSAAHDPELDRLVAVKVMHAGPAAHSPAARLRLQRDAQAMARLHHPNVVAVYDAGAIGGRTFLAMELAEAPTLAAWPTDPRDARRVVDVFRQAGRGLAAPHAAGITHRAFKPSNVILRNRVRVVDFGLARRADDDAAAKVAPSALSPTVTHSAAVLGTRKQASFRTYLFTVAKRCSADTSRRCADSSVQVQRRRGSGAAVLGTRKQASFRTYLFTVAKRCSADTSRRCADSSVQVQRRRGSGGVHGVGAACAVQCAVGSVLHSRSRCARR